MESIELTELNTMEPIELNTMAMELHLAELSKTGKVFRMFKNGICGNTRRGKFARALVCTTLTMLLIIAIYIAVWIAHYPLPVFKARMHQLRIDGICDQSLVVSGTLEAFFSDKDVKVSNVRVAASFAGVEQISLLLPDTILQFGWTMHNFTFPISVNQRSLVQQLDAWSAGTSSWREGIVRASADVSLPILGVRWSKHPSITKSMSELDTSAEPTEKKKTAFAPYVHIIPGYVLMNQTALSIEQGLEVGMFKRFGQRKLSVFGIEQAMPAVADDYWNYQFQQGLQLTVPVPCIAV
jgi:hypothetical protein